MMIVESLLVDCATRRKATGYPSNVNKKRICSMCWLFSYAPSQPVVGSAYCIKQWWTTGQCMSAIISIWSNMSQSRIFFEYLFECCTYFRILPSSLFVFCVQFINYVVKLPISCCIVNSHPSISFLPHPLSISLACLPM